MIKDGFGNTIEVGSFVCYATTRQVWPGEVLEIREYVDYYGETTYKIQVEAEKPGGGYRKISLDYVPEKIYVVR